MNTERGPGRPKSDPDAAAWTFKQWYDKNKKKLADKRKAKYHSDPKHREQILEANRKARAEKTKNKPVQLDHHRRTVLVEIERGGTTVSVPAYHIKNLSDKISKTPPTIYGWERNGVIPITPFWTGNESKPERLYTSDMIEIVSKALNKRGGRVSLKDHTFFNEIKNEWLMIGVIAIEESTSGKA